MMYAEGINTHLKDAVMLLVIQNLLFEAGLAVIQPPPMMNSGLITKQLRVCLPVIFWIPNSVLWDREPLVVREPGQVHVQDALLLRLLQQTRHLLVLRGQPPLLQAAALWHCNSWTQEVAKLDGSPTPHVTRWCMSERPRRCRLPAPSDPVQAAGVTLLHGVQSGSETLVTGT